MSIFVFGSVVQDGLVYCVCLSCAVMSLFFFGSVRACSVCPFLPCVALSLYVFGTVSPCLFSVSPCLLCVVSPGLFYVVCVHVFLVYR